MNRKDHHVLSKNLITPGIQLYPFSRDYTELYISNRKNMKYMILDDNNKFIHFGRIGYEDYTKHKDEKRRINYLKRAKNIKGDWKNNKYSPNQLSINILWT